MNLRRLEAFTYSRRLNCIATYGRSGIYYLLLELNRRWCLRLYLPSAATNKHCWWCHYWTLGNSVGRLLRLTPRHHARLSWGIYNTLIYIGRVSLYGQLVASWTALFLLAQYLMLLAAKWWTAVADSPILVVVIFWFEWANAAWTHYFYIIIY